MIIIPIQIRIDATTHGHHQKTADEKKNEYHRVFGYADASRIAEIF
jgi:hypothetical protein